MKPDCNLLTRLVTPPLSQERRGSKSMAAEITLENHYAELAKRFRAMASVETGPRKVEFEHLAECYEHAALDQDKAEQLAE